MSPTILPKIFDTNLSGVRYSFEQQQRRDFTRQQAEELFGLCQFLAHVVEWSWTQIGEALKQVAEGFLISRTLRILLAQVEESLRIYTRFQADVTAAPPAYPGLQADLANLEKSSAVVERIRQQMAALLNWVDTPLPRLDVNALPKGEESPTAEGYERGERILERLRSGGNV